MHSAASRTASVVFVNRFYWPDEPATGQLLTDLAEALAARGLAVTVIARHSGQAGLPRVQSHRGVTIRRVRGTDWGRTSAAGKAVDFATFTFTALWALCFTARRGDHIVALTDPPLIGIGAWLVARLRGARIHHWVQDIYPEIAMTLSGQQWLRIIRPLRNLAWRRADGCVTLGSDMAATLAAAGVRPDRIDLIPNWAPAGLTFQPAATAQALRREWRLEGKFVVAYSGNLGRVHDLGPVIAVAAELRADPGIAFVFVGGGAQRARLEAEVAQRGLPNVQFHPPQPRDRLNESLALGDLHLVTLLPGCERLVFPSKLYGVTAVGRPVIVIGPPGCELARLVEAQGFGRAFAREEISRIAASIRELSTDRPAMERLGQAAGKFGAAATGPGLAAARWQERLGAIR